MLRRLADPERFERPTPRFVVWQESLRDQQAVERRATVAQHSRRVPGGGLAVAVATLLLTACAPAPLTDQTYEFEKYPVIAEAATPSGIVRLRAWDCPHRLEAAKHCRERSERERPAPQPPERPEPPTKPEPEPEPEPPTEPEKPTPPEKEPPEDKPKPEKGNPGNDRPVGNAGEAPNGKGGWGDGDKGNSR